MGKLHRQKRVVGECLRCIIVYSKDSAARILPKPDHGACQPQFVLFVMAITEALHRPS
jgi:hypothetical protein